MPWAVLNAFGAAVRPGSLCHMERSTNRTALTTRAFRLEYLTIGWNVIEAIVAVSAGIAAGSLALIGFGLDSLIEVFAATVVVWQLRGVSEERERRALRLIALSFFVLAGFVAVEAVRDLVAGAEAQESMVGIALAAVSLVVMPALAIAKRHTAQRMNSATLLADSTETRLCSYLSAILLAGLVLNATVGWWWADSLAALGIGFLAAREGVEIWRVEHEPD
jgi:divalent metal cation (Fe/Co/Zn/Cd) transporter